MSKRELRSLFNSWTQALIFENKFETSMPTQTCRFKKEEEEINCLVSN